MSFFIVAASGCVELQKIDAERNQPANNGSESKLQSGPALPGRNVSTTAQTLANAAQAAGIDSGAAARTPTATAPAELAVTAIPPRDASRTYVGTGNFINQNPPVQATSVGAEEFTLNFEALDIRQIVQYILGDYLKEFFTIHPQTSGNATIRTSKPVSKQDLLPILEMLLRQNGQVIVKEEGMYKIMPANLGLKGSISPVLGGSSKPLPPGYSVQIIQLKFVGVADMARILLPYQIDPSSVQQDPVRNLLILSGTQRELRHLLDIVDLFDVDFLAGYSVGLYQLSTDVKALGNDLNSIFGAGTASPLAGIVKYIPIERLNALLVVTTQPRYLEEAKKWIERLDKSGGVAGGLRLNVYPVQHGKAEKLATLLSEVYGNKQGTGTTPALAPGQRPGQVTTAPVAPGSPTAPQTPLQTAIQSLVSFAGGGVGVSKDVRIIADNDNNALLILASPSDYETIQSALRQLDVPRRQVSVEVLVAEVTLTDDLKFGIEWFVNARNNTVGSLRGVNGDGSVSGVLPRLPGVLNAAGVALDPRSLIGAAPGLQLINLGPGGDIRAVLQALGRDGRSKVISTPRVMVLDNEKATLNVGSQISVDTGASTGTGTGGNVVTTRQYLSTGVILNVTPRINAGGRVTLDVNQEVSSPIGDGTNPTISTRKAQTVVTVSSGETMILAGLMQDTNSTGSSGVPLLSKIPLIGALFGTQTLNKTRTELVLLITPTVVTNSDDARAVTEELRRKLPSLEKFLPTLQK
ncbi:MAG: type II secretion system secretin GspD [Aeromicrobium sp.]|nr:type II secretion system secretin GspD [Burkholderiales bacterium]